MVAMSKMASRRAAKGGVRSAAKGQMRSAAKKSSRKVGKIGMRKTAKKGAPTSQKRYAEAPSGFVKTGRAGLVVPESASHTGNTVPAGKLKRGISSARDKIDETLAELVDALKGDYEIAEIKINASFSAEGKFLGFGIGGAMSVEITVRPS